MRSTLELFAGSTGAIFPSFSSAAPSGWILLNADTDANTGGGGAHNNMQPWGAVNFMVKL